MTTLHFIRPWWLLMLIPVWGLFFALIRQSPSLQSWRGICDAHLLTALSKQKGAGRRTMALFLLALSMTFMIVGLTGPSWSKYPVPTYKRILPRVIVLDVSQSMLAKDVSPNRLQRAKFKLHDLFEHPDRGQMGLIVYTSEPFVASPITDDAKTIDALLPALTPEMMPVSGNRLETALVEAKKLIQQAGSQQGDILVLTGKPPSKAAIQMAKKLSSEGIESSIISIAKSPLSATLFQSFAKAGQGQWFTYRHDTADIEQWLKKTNLAATFDVAKQQQVPIWRDQGRWFIVPAFLFLLPVFRRGWLQRVAS